MKKPFSIPLGGSYNTRVTDTGAQASSSGIIGRGVIGVMVIGRSTLSTTKDQRFINCFTHQVVNPYTNKKTLYLVKRPGFDGSATAVASGLELT